MQCYKHSCHQITCDHILIHLTFSFPATLLCTKHSQRSRNIAEISPHGIYIPVEQADFKIKYIKQDNFTSNECHK